MPDPLPGVSAGPSGPTRIFLDSGVLIEGCFSQWGASKGVLILAAQRREDFRIVLSDPVEREVRRTLANAATTLPPERAT